MLRGCCHFSPGKRWAQHSQGEWPCPAQGPGSCKNPSAPPCTVSSPCSTWVTQGRNGLGEVFIFGKEPYPVQLL